MAAKQQGDTSMRKLILSVLAGASLLGTVVSTAQAQAAIGIQLPLLPPVAVQVPVPKVCVGPVCSP
jgi:hypothetical protein